jgi:3-oxoacyl-[acyl-carrier protein] reductase
MTMLDGTTVLLTGAAGGMGVEMALALANAGAMVAAADRDAERLRRLVERAHPLGAAQNIHPLTVDLADAGECERLVPRVLHDCGGLDALVNLAGIGMEAVASDLTTRPPRFWDYDMAGWQRLVDVNLRAPWLLAVAATRHMLGRPRGRIVNITTSFDSMLMSGLSAYGQSKAALEASTASWAGDLAGTAITVNALAPGGPTNTPFFPAYPDIDRDRLIQPDVMGPPLVWLLSPASDGFTNRRVLARLWDTTLPPHEAAASASAPAAWAGFGSQAVRPRPDV